jgi:hypothetical protein
MMVRFATKCDRCGARSEEYTAWPHCEFCGEDLCLACEAKGHCDVTPALVFHGKGCECDGCDANRIRKQALAVVELRCQVCGHEARRPTSQGRLCGATRDDIDLGTGECVGTYSCDGEMKVLDGEMKVP